MIEHEPGTRFFVYALREGRGWKLAHGNLDNEGDAYEARATVAEQAGVKSTKIMRVRIDVFDEA